MLITLLPAPKPPPAVLFIFRLAIFCALLVSIARVCCWLYNCCGDSFACAAW